MDRDTLLAHEDRWGTDPARRPAPRLTHLNQDEAALHDDLVTDRLGDLQPV